ncbi:MAG: hypothetical protein ABIR59_05715 [Gemmatimonadales bacterium]
MRHRFLAVLTLAAIACAAPPIEPISSSPPGGGLRLLFLGNSLTYVHDVPQLVISMATAIGRPPRIVVTRAAANLGLEDHWNDAKTRAFVMSGHFDFVIMQQGPSTLPESRIDLLHWAEVLSAAARRHGARPAMYGVWPTRGGDIDAGITNYSDAATANDALLLPVAAAWRATWAADPSMPLQGSDDFHQGVHGAWLAALVIASVLYDLPPERFPNLFPAIITAAQESVMKAAATSVVARGR